MRKGAKEGRCEGRKPLGYYEGEATALERARSLRAQNLGFDRIAARLNEDRIPTHKPHSHTLPLKKSKHRKRTETERASCIGNSRAQPIPDLPRFNSGLPWARCGPFMEPLRLSA